MAKLTHLTERRHLPFRPFYCPDCRPGEDAAFVFVLHGGTDFCSRCGREIDTASGVYAAHFYEDELPSGDAAAAP